MALVACRECGNKVSNQAARCPHCGIADPAIYPIPERRQRGGWGTAVVVLGISAGVFGGWLLLNAPKDPVPSLAVSASVPPAPSLSATEQAAVDAKAAEARRLADAKAAQEQKAKDAACAKDIHCLGEKAFAGATVRCRPVVERLAKNNFEWIDGWLEPKFSHYRWKDQKRGVITYVGDRIKYQNGFGAWVLSIYECDYDTGTERVVDARARPGQLSQ